MSSKAVTVWKRSLSRRWVKMTDDRIKLQQQIGYLPVPELRAIESAILHAIDVHVE